MNKYIFLTQEEFDKIPETLRGEYHPSKSNYTGKYFAGNICVTLNATHRTYVVGRELMIVNPEEVEEKDLRHIIVCDNCGEISLADTRHTNMCIYCASMYNAKKSVPGKDELPDAVQKKRAAQDLARSAIQSAKRATTALPDSSRNPLSYRFLNLLEPYCSAVQLFMKSHTGEFYDDQSVAVEMAIELLIRKVKAAPVKYARPFNYFKRYVIDGVSLRIVRQEYRYSQVMKEEVFDFLKDCIGDDWQLRFIMGYDAANKKILEERKKKGKKNQSDHKIAAECIKQLIKQHAISAYIRPAENIKNHIVLNQSAALAEAEKVCSCLRNGFYNRQFLIVVYLDSPFEKNTGLFPKWKKSSMSTEKPDSHIYDIAIPKQARQNLYSLSQYVLTTLACIYAKENEIKASIESDGITCNRALAEIAFQHGLMVERIDQDKYKIYDVNDKVVADLESKSWPKWLYFCIEDRRDKKVIERESGIVKRVIDENSLAKEFLYVAPVEEVPKDKVIDGFFERHGLLQSLKEEEQTADEPVQECVQVPCGYGIEYDQQEQQDEISQDQSEYCAEPISHEEALLYAEAKLNEFINLIHNGGANLLFPENQRVSRTGSGQKRLPQNYSF